MDKNKTLTEAANDLIEHAMERGIPGRMIPFMEALRVAKNERKAESEAARLEIDSLKAKNLELEQLCDATYVAQGADAYNHACSMMEQYEAEREAARKEVGTEGSLCDGISWLYTRIASLESQLEGGKSEALADLAYAHGMTTGWNLCIADKHDEFARIRSMRSSQAISTIEAPQPPAQAAPVDAAVQEDAKDAARYRFLRDGEWRDTGLERYIVLQLGLMWDDKIDAAIAAQQGGANG